MSARWQGQSPLNKLGLDHLIADKLDFTLELSFAFRGLLWHCCRMVGHAYQDLPLSVLQVEPDLCGRRDPFPCTPEDAAYDLYDSPAPEMEDLWLLRSMARFGILQPLVVYEAAPGSFIIVDGHRRFYAAKYLRMVDAPCIVKQGLSMNDALALRLVLEEDGWSNSNEAMISGAMGAG